MADLERLAVSVTKALPVIGEMTEDGLTVVDRIRYEDGRVIIVARGKSGEV